MDSAAAFYPVWEYCMNLYKIIWLLPRWLTGIRCELAAILCRNKFLQARVKKPGLKRKFKFFNWMKPKQISLDICSLSVCSRNPKPYVCVCVCMIKYGPEPSWINGFKTKSAKRILLHIFTPSSSVVMRTLSLEQDVIWQSTSWEMLSCGHILHQHCSIWQWTGRAALTCFLKAPGSLSCAYETVIRGCLWKSEVEAVDVVTSSQSLLLYRPRKLSGSFPAVGSESEIKRVLKGR